eukprot:6207743-Pleurochrysis_carterae.AAC.3
MGVSRRATARRSRSTSGSGQRGSPRRSAGSASVLATAHTPAQASHHAQPGRGKSRGEGRCT